MDDKNPHRVRIGKWPCLKHFKVFGCDSYAYVSKENNGELDNKAIKLIFVGYKYGMKGVVI